MTPSVRAKRRSARVGSCASARSAVAAEVVLSERARATLEQASPRERKALLAALADIEDDPTWGAGPPRMLAPGHSPNSGYLADLSVQTWAIIYRVVDKGAAVEVPEIRRIFVG